MSFKFTELGDRIFTAMALVCITCLLALSGALTRVDNLLYDFTLNLWVKPAPNDIVIVAIDEASLENISYWPWPRSLYTELLQKLASAQTRAIGLDVDFSEPQHDGSDIDRALVGAIAQAGNVIMPILLENPYVGSPLMKLRLPIPAAANDVAGLGRVNVLFDYDGVTRGVYLWQGLSANGFNAKGFPHYAQSVLQVARQLPASLQMLAPDIKVAKASVLNRRDVVAGQLVSYDLRKVGFLGPPGHFQRISYAKVLSGQYPAGYFKDKIVLIGVTAAGLGYTLPTPFFFGSESMSRVEFHANVIAAMRGQQLIF